MIHHTICPKFCEMKINIIQGKKQKSVQKCLDIQDSFLMCPSHFTYSLQKGRIIECLCKKCVKIVAKW